uniref:Calponin-homology (CH) domain-containing protein n=1 Tax=Emiliania huxleyi TaxID=2903 RepID=A0A7S3SBB2_EMIHU
MLVHGGGALTATADSSHAAPQPAAPADDALGQITTAVASNAAEAVVFEQATDPRAPHFAAQPLGAPPPAAPAAGGPPLPEHATVAMGHLHQTVLELPSSVATPGAADPDAFADSERAALARHLNWALASDEHASASLPIDPSCSAFFGAVANGIVLSKYALRVDSTALDERALNLPGERGQLLGREDMLQNQSLCLNAATAIGCGVPGLTPQQMVDAPPSGQQRALQLVWNMVRSALLNPIQASKNPEIHGMLLAGEDPASLARYRPEKVLQRWVNHHIRGYLEASPEQASVPRTFRVTNLHADLADGLALSIVLHQVAPRRSAAVGVSEAALASSSADERVRLAIEAAELCGVEMFEVDAADVLEARPRMLLAFVAAIFRTCPGLDAQAEPEAPASKRGRRGNRSQEREEAALRMWMASLGLGLESLSSLYEDCRTGVVFLRLLDFLRPGAVDWSRVLLEPRSIYERVQNCNRAVSVARQVGLVVAGFSGKDLADGISMYILSMASQLMRTHACQFLEALGMGDADMLEWANCQIKRHDEAMPNLRNFADPQIRTGVFLLKLLRSVAPECAREELILSGTTEEERAQNARYAISCAHKAGCTVFATWEDVVEGRPRMMLCLLAAIMAEDLRRHAAEPVDKDLPTPNQS